MLALNTPPGASAGAGGAGAGAGQAASSDGAAGKKAEEANQTLFALISTRLLRNLQYRWVGGEPALQVGGRVVADVHVPHCRS